MASIKKDQNTLRSLIAQNKAKEAEKFLSDSVLKKNSAEQLLYLMEAGMISYRNAEYDQAMKLFQQAIDVYEMQYKKLTEMLKSAIVQQTGNDFQGRPFELSYLYYFATLSAYQEYLKTNKQNLLFSARSYLLLWDNYLKSLAEHQSYYTNDYYARFFAALMHETIGGRSDQEIALQLYQDADQLFNQEIDDATHHNLSSSSSSPLTNEFSETFKNNFHDVVVHRILRLASILRSAEISKWVEQYEKKYHKKFTLLDHVKKSPNASDQLGSVTFLSHEGLIPELKADVIDLNINHAKNDPSATGEVHNFADDANFSLFAYQVLGLKGAIYGLASLKFEVPLVEYHLPQEFSKQQIKVFDAQGNVAGSCNLELIQSLGSWSQRSNAAERSSRLLTTGARFAAKHVAAMIGAYALYKSMTVGLKKGESSGFATLSAMASYFGAAELISLSEKADTRYWSTLPSDIYSCSIELPKGVYSSQVVSAHAESSTSFSFPNWQLDAGATKIFPVMDQF